MKTIEGANKREFSQGFDPVFSADGILNTPSRSTPDANALYLNAASEALSEVEKYDDSLA